MKTAFLILADRNPNQLCRLVKTLDAGDTVFLIHVDRRLPVRVFMKPFGDMERGNVYFCPWRVEMDGSRGSMADAVISLLGLLSEIKPEADYVHLVSGLDHPLKPVEELTGYFKKNREKSYWTLEQNPARYILPNGMAHYRGDFWWSLPGKCANHLAESVPEHMDLYDTFQERGRKEDYLPTLLMNSSFRNTLVSNNLRYDLGSFGKNGKHALSDFQKSEEVTFPGLFVGEWDVCRDGIPKGFGEVLSCIQQLSRKKCCVISAVGRESLHREWINGEADFDLHLIVYDDSYSSFMEDSPHVSQGKGYKFRLVYEYLLRHPEIIDRYDYFYIPDDDILIAPEEIQRLFRNMEAYGLAIAQPAIANNYFSYPHTVRQSGSMIRFTNFVEIMQPCFSREALKKVLFTFRENEGGWGLDFHWGRLVDYRQHNMAIIDDIPSVHTRPVRSGGTRKNHEELRAYLHKYGLDTGINCR